MSFKKVLIANRAEIACRVIRGAQAQGYPTVAVYSEADAGAPHVSLADEAVCIGPAPAAESYLVIDKIIAAAKQTGADAIHPGYGFLAENAEFAKACADAGVTFIGPSPEAIDLMGNKRAAKIKMQAAGVPCIPGYEDSQEDEELIAAAKGIGLPVMVKAAAGGGGRGMRLVHVEADLAAAIQSARSEASSAFGSGELILEKALIDARHVEIQVFGDTAGNVIHLGERDCSIQRRHQKVVEESPSPAVDESLRQRMGEAACAAAAAVDYVGAGTVEFLLAADGEFYFLEMNTRLQVEHPVTELVTGIDLVAWQLRVAAGDALPKSQDEINLNGHAIEVRLCAEDPSNDFLPQTGTALAWQPPSGEGVRCDAGLVQGQVLSPHYDSMQAKLIAWGETREVARQRLLAAMESCVLHGVTSNKDFLATILANEVFASGDYNTGFIEAEMPDWQPEAADLPLAAAVLLHDDAAKLGNEIGAARLGWRSSPVYPVPVLLQQGEEDALEQDVISSGFGAYSVKLESSQQEGSQCDIALCAVRKSEAGFSFTKGRIDGGASQLLRWTRDGRELWLSSGGQTVKLLDATLLPPDAGEAGGDGQIRAPMDGKLLSVTVTAGEQVEKGQTVAVLEAMKMETSLVAGVSGTVEAVSCADGDQVKQGSVLVRITPEAETE